MKRRSFLQLLAAALGIGAFVRRAPAAVEVATPAPVTFGIDVASPLSGAIPPDVIASVLNSEARIMQADIYRSLTARDMGLSSLNLDVNPLPRPPQPNRRHGW